MPQEEEHIELSSEFKAALEELEQSKVPLFITGKAGTGKSTLLRYFVRNSSRKVVVLAPTGVAALHIGGQTIHSFFKFPSRLITPEEIRTRYASRIYERLDTIIIDEISMVRADMLDNIDRFLRLNRKRPYEPFGGVRMIFFGDLFQLPPVVKQEEMDYVKQHYKSPYFFSAKVLSDIELRMIELRQVYRQTDRRFIRLLNAVRLNQIEQEDMEELNARANAECEEDENYITLSARNATVDAINKEKLESINEEQFTYLGELKGEFSEYNTPTDIILHLKVGAQVIFVKNDPKGRFVNGSIGKILSLDMNNIQVGINQDGKYLRIDLEKTSWENHKYKLNEKGEIAPEVIGSFTQYPVKLAWAITIHKSQGKTFERVIIDLGKGAFEHGQTYVALSRCRTLNGIVLKKQLSYRDILTDERIVDFYEQLL